MDLDNRTAWLMAVALLATVVALAAAASGGVEGSGTASSGERNALKYATLVAVAASAVMLWGLVTSSENASRAAAATACFVAATTFAIPAAWAFASHVSTGAADSTGCGRISTPYYQDYVVRGNVPDYVLTAQASCIDRLRLQKALVAVLLLPSVVAGVWGATLLIRSSREQEAGTATGG